MNTNNTSAVRNGKIWRLLTCSGSKTTSCVSSAGSSLLPLISFSSVPGCWPSCSCLWPPCSLASWPNCSKTDPEKKKTLIFLYFIVLCLRLHSQWWEREKARHCLLDGINYCKVTKELSCTWLCAQLPWKCRCLHRSSWRRPGRAVCVSCGLLHLSQFRRVTVRLHFGWESLRRFFLGHEIHHQNQLFTLSAPKNLLIFVVMRYEWYRQRINKKAFL